jgi:sugar transferase (PEP-CTERM/EpsH1 system associated)
VKLLYLAHRLPYPPNKGDKVRSYHLLRHLAARHEVHVGTFVDDADDLAHVDALRPLCAELHVEFLRPARAAITSAASLLSRTPLTLSYYRSGSLARWVDRTVALHGIGTAVVFSSAMAQYVDRHPQLRVLVDFVDVDSAKWRDYAGSRAWPLSWLYAEEGRRLLRYEAATAARAARSFFVTERECALFRELAPHAAAGIEAVSNGVDAEYHSPAHALASPFAAAEKAIVFTGAMDYWPNVDAVQWFAADVLPRLRAADPSVRFHIVGMRPAPEVRALAGEGIVVTGTVPDVRPYVRHCAVAVAPLRIARGIQNKVLEAMAMARPVVASRACAAGLDCTEGEHLLVAGDAQGFADAVGGLLREPARAQAIGDAARARVLARYSWDAHLAAIDAHLGAGAVPGVARERVLSTA